MTGHIRERTVCRVCEGHLITVLELGDLRLNDFPRSQELCQVVQTVPHTLTVCGRCSLAQLRHTAPPDWLYRNYYYQSHINEMMVQELRSIVYQIRSLVRLAADDLVLDIGANDGTLLGQYALSGYPPRRLAVEPALNLHAQLTQHCELATTEYFPTDVFDHYAGRIKVVTAIAVCYDLEDPVAFFAKIHQLLHPEGICIVQFQDMGQMLQTCAFDNVVPEHLEHYTLGSLLEVVHRAGLEVVHCLTTPINGGSLRVTLRPRTTLMKYYPKDTIHLSVEQQLLAEHHLGLCPHTIQNGNLSAYTRFAQRVVVAQRQIRAAVDAILDQGATLHVLGASTKGNVLLQVLRIGPDVATVAIDRSPEKKGRYTVTGIPIEDEIYMQQWPASAYLVPIWQFRPSVLARQRWYLQQGGSLIFPLPVVEIVKDTYDS